ncbi:MAG: hypothetical protein KGR16_04085 [Verrucomicrobia bacterium]|nr:hypothetical protein [Verrucomicrobiota bacterium]MDE3046800.1 hypothetical protein [Verrucomicrobiota bacterium]
MKKHPIATIVNFCSNESRFLRATLEQALLFSKQVIVPVCDHFFDGSPENLPLLETIYSAFPECLFIEYPYLPKKIPKKILKKVDLAHFWHSLSRLIAVSFLDEEIETVLFLDADEVPEGKKFAQWLDCSDYRQHTTLKLSNFWYFRDPANQALKFEDSVVLVQKKALESEILLHQDERDAIYNLLPGPKRRNVTGVDGKPMFHHYSWVRTQAEMLQKVKAWGHKGDRDWASLVHEEFSGPFRGTDFVHGYHYQLVKPPFEIRFEPPQFEAKGAPKIKRLKEEELLKHVRQKRFWELAF